MENQNQVTKRGGYNRKSNEERRSGWLRLRVSNEEMQMLKELARSKGLPVSAYVRSKVLDLL